MTGIGLPGASGLTRFNEDSSKFKISPAQVVVMIIITLLFVIGLNIFFPIT
ncbi:MAG: preprotein translocase subunit Sec61beta [Nanoarchaeota archaeon]